MNKKKIERIRKKIIDFEFDTDTYHDLDFISRIINELAEALAEKDPARRKMNYEMAMLYEDTAQENRELKEENKELNEELNKAVQEASQLKKELIKLHYYL